MYGWDNTLFKKRRCKPGWQTKGEGMVLDHAILLKSSNDYKTNVHAQYNVKNMDELGCRMY